MKKVLIVDNSSYMRMFVKKIIEKKEGYAILEADSRENAIETFNLERPEIVVLDLNMSETTMDGIPVLKEIMGTAPETNVIIISAVGDKDVKAECIELGAKSFINKPIDTDALLNALE